MRYITSKSIDELDRNIVSIASRINAATYELLILVRQFDERAGWLQWGLGNCAEWKNDAGNYVVAPSTLSIKPIALT